VYGGLVQKKENVLESSMQSAGERTFLVQPLTMQRPAREVGSKTWVGLGFGGKRGGSGGTACNDGVGCAETVQYQENVFGTIDTLLTPYKERLGGREAQAQAQPDDIYGCRPVDLFIKKGGFRRKGEWDSTKSGKVLPHYQNLVLR
jgi:hypothetical protein